MCVCGCVWPDLGVFVRVCVSDTPFASLHGIFLSNPPRVRAVAALFQLSRSPSLSIFLSLSLSLPLSLFA